MTFPSKLAARHPAQRGSSLLLVIVILAILAVAAFGIVTMGSTETDAVGAKRRYDRAVSCSDAARELVLSQFRTSGMSPTQVTLNSVVEDQRAATGHYDNLAVSSVVAVKSTGGTGAAGPADISNRISKVNLGGQLYRMTVVCSNSGTSLTAGTRQSEVEFLVKFGL